MNKQFEILVATRKNMLKEIEGLTDEQLFVIPNGFANHIAWNLMHIMASEQLLCYASTQNPLSMDADLITSFRGGSQASTLIDPSVISFIRANMLKMLDTLQSDYQKGIFQNYKPRTLSYGLDLNTIEDALSFLGIHEAVHYGQIKMLKRILITPTSTKNG